MGLVIIIARTKAPHTMLACWIGHSNSNHTWCWPCADRMLHNHKYSRQQFQQLYVYFVMVFLYFTVSILSLLACCWFHTKIYLHSIAAVSVKLYLMMSALADYGDLSEWSLFGDPTLTTAHLGGVLFDADRCLLENSLDIDSGNMADWCSDSSIAFLSGVTTTLKVLSCPMDEEHMTNDC